MKKKALVPLLIIAIVSGLAWASCLDGNNSVTFVVNGQATDEFCCKAVGDGTAWSCTSNNKDWILVGE